MGITFYPSQLKAESFVFTDSHSESTAQVTFQAVQGRRTQAGLFLSSFSLHGSHDPKIVPAPKGLFASVLEAYNHHRMLIIRPDDIWITILTQLNFYINDNAERLRGSFVNHQGKKELIVYLPGLTMDVEYTAKAMVDLMQENITDPSIQEWVMPGFSTTTTLDRTVCAIVMMSTFQKYFEFSARSRCGLPGVRLEGTKADWQSILRRIEKLKEYGLHTTAWYHLLRPVLKRIVSGFDDPSGAANLDFWRTVMHYHRRSGGDHVTGWINAFYAFSKHGKYIGPKLATGVQFDPEDVDMDTATFWKKYGSYDVTQHSPTDVNYLQLDGIPYGRLPISKFPPGCVGVDIKLEGQLAPVSDCAFLAGIGAFSVSSSGDRIHSMTGQLDTIQPIAGWWLYMKE